MTLHILASLLAVGAAYDDTMLARFAEPDCFITDNNVVVVAARAL